MSNSEKQPVKVIFRRWVNSNILALMPYEFSGVSLMCSSYERNGQHSGADYSHCIRSTKPATKAEYSYLERELEHIGYSVTVINRVNNDLVFKAAKEYRERLNK